MNKHLTCAWFVLVLALTGCSSQLRTGESRLIESSGSDSYKLLNEPGVFVGVSRRFSDEASARNDAALDARRQIINSLEMEIETALADTLFIHGKGEEILSADVFTHSRTMAAASNILRVAPIGYYVERWLESGSGGVNYYYKAWCPIRYTREDHNRMLEEVVANLISVSEPFYNDAVAYRQQGQIRNAMFRLQLISGLKNELTGYSAVPPELTARMDEIILRANDVARGITVLITIDETINGKHLTVRQFEPRLAAALGNENVLSVKSSFDFPKSDIDRMTNEPGQRIAIANACDADLLLTGSASVDYIVEKTKGFHIGRFKATLELVETATGIVLWKTSLPGSIVNDTRGFANTSERAAERALSLADYPDDQGDPFSKLSASIINAVCGPELKS